MSMSMVTTSVFSQEIEPKEDVNIDDLGNVSDEFQEHFFEALKQKAITNYDKAIVSIEKCIKINPKLDFLYLELGKNYLKQKSYQKAADNFNKVLEGSPKEYDRFVLELLFESYYKLKDYKQAMFTAEKLVVYKPMFKEQLANLYYLDKRYDEALSLLDDLDQKFGNDSYRNKIRKRIASKITDPSSQIASLENKIKNAPKNEQNYLNLIFMYSKKGDNAKAFETAKLLSKNNPKSELVHLSLYKFYLDKKNVDAAISSMKVALKSTTISGEAKQKVVTDFLTFIDENPSHQGSLNEVVKIVKGDKNNGKLFAALGNYFYKHDNKEQALNFYEYTIKNASNDFKLLKRILLLQVDMERYDKALLGSEMAIELYPAQPIFYLLNGTSLLNTNKPKEAIDILLTGIDYVIDDEKMESDFYAQLSKSYKATGDVSKAEEFQKKSSTIKNTPN